MKQLKFKDVKIGQLFVDYYGRLCRKNSETELQIISLDYQKPTNPNREIDIDIVISTIIES